MQVTHQVGL